MNITSTGIAVALAVVVAFGFIFFGPVLFSSPDSSGTLSFMNEPQEESVSMGETLELPGGLQVTDMAVGSGTAVTPGDEITVNYTGMLEDGTVFDSSVGRGPFVFTIGRGEVIAGWEQGLIGMQEGGKRLLVIPPSMAYGNQDKGVIPPNSTLIFEVELLTVKKP